MHRPRSSAACSGGSDLFGRNAKSGHDRERKSPSRDDKGRFTKEVQEDPFHAYDLYVLGIDERGDFGFSIDSMKAMVLAGSGTSRSEIYEALSKEFPANTRGEIKPGEEGVLKFHSSNDDVRRGMVGLIAISDADLYVSVYVKEEKHPKKPVRIYADMYKDIITAAAAKTDAERIKVILDQSTYITSNKAESIARDVLGERVTEVTIMATKDSPFLQTNEFVVGPASQLIEVDDHEIVEPLRDRIRFWRHWNKK